MNKFKIGDNVKTISDCGTHTDDYKIGIVSKITSIVDVGEFIYKIPFENTYYWCKENELELVEDKNYTFADFEKCPVGTKITFENNVTLVKYINIHSEIENSFKNFNHTRSYKDLLKFKDNCGQLGKIIKIEEPTYKEINFSKTKQEILDKKEKEYLINFIKPFNVILISKCETNGNTKYHLVIKIKNNNDNEYIYLPTFNKNSKMYKNMKIDKEYTLKELGLKN